MFENSKPTKTKTEPDFDEFGDIDDILNPKAAAPISVIDDEGSTSSGPGFDDLRTNSAADTKRKTGQINPSDEMRDYMSRIDRSAVPTQPDEVETPQDAVALRTASDVPAVISNAMRASGTESPDWHSVRNLPGMTDRVIRDIGATVFGTFTSTPPSQIKTIANVNGQGPNTQAEVNAVASWLKNNATDLGKIDVDFGQAIPDYKPDIREFSINDVRFQVVRDPMGQYIYAYPEKDARSNTNQPRLNEKMITIHKPTLFEQLKWDEELEEAFGKPTAKDRANRQQAGYQKRADAAAAAGEEPPEAPKEKSALARRIGKMAGGQRLIRHLHKIHKLSNEAELEPVKFKESLLWGQFKSNPDDFIIVSGGNGVAGIKPSKKSIDAYIASKQKKGETPNLAGAGSAIKYQIIAFTDDGQQVDPALLHPTDDGNDSDKKKELKDPDPTVIGSRMGKTIGQDLQNSNNTFSLLNDQIGPITTIWIAGWSGYRGTDKSELQPPKGAVERDKIAARANSKVVDSLPPDEAMDKILQKVRPVLKKLGDQALSQLMRSAKRYTEGGNFEAGQKIMGSAQKLKNFLVSLDTNQPLSANATGSDLANNFRRAIVKSIEGAAGARKGTDEFNEWLNDAATGNSAALKPVLDSLREVLVNIPSYDY